MRTKNKGLSLIEVLVAMGIAAVVITVALGTVGNIFVTQKKIRVSQNFASESRFLMERLVQMVRNNTIDFDRYFLTDGPDAVACANFAAQQTPEGVGVVTNDAAGRATLDYPTIFYWDTNGDDTPDRNLGGRTPAGENDPCAKAWTTSPQTTLSLINGTRTVRTAIRQDQNDPDFRHVQLQKQLGADTNNDGTSDLWGPLDGNADEDYDDPEDVQVVWDLNDSNLCELSQDGQVFRVLGEADSEDFCDQAHDWNIISPEQLEVQVLRFEPSPSRDPFLNFAVDEAQIHPHVFLYMTAKLRNPQEFGMDVAEAPTLSLQTAASSRVFGNSRK